MLLLPFLWSTSIPFIYVVIYNLQNPLVTVISKILRNFGRVASHFATLNVGNVSHRTFKVNELPVYCVKSHAL